MYFGVIVSTKIATKILKDFCPKIFCSFLRAFWKLFGLSGDLVSDIINKEGYTSPKKAIKTFRAEFLTIF